jgi:exopolysaccharide production protein ExoZ
MVNPARGPWLDFCLPAPIPMKTTAKLNNIQLLRAFAAVAVVVFHTGFVLPGMRLWGSFGVDVFFVISGYIMARILDPASDASSDYFFRRRVLRIVPPYWSFTFLIFLAALRFPQLMGATHAGFLDLLKSLFFIPFSKENGLIQPLLFIGWSLNYEMFFYCALAIGLLLNKRMLTKRLSSRISPVWIGALLVALVSIACHPFAAHSIPADFYARDIVFEFILGVLSYALCRAIPTRTAVRLRLPALFLTFASALLLIAIQAILPQPGYFYGMRLLSLGLPSFLLVTSASLLSQADWDARLTSLVLIGDASYILYLLHPFCEYALDRALGPHHHWLRSNTASGAAVGVTTSIGLAVLIHLYAERPTVRFLNRRFGGKRKSTEFATPALP